MIEIVYFDEVRWHWTGRMSVELEVIRASHYAARFCLETAIVRLRFHAP